MLQDITNARLEILLGKMKRINGLCETEEQVFYRGEESLNTVCNVLKCKTKSVIAEVIEYVSKQHYPLLTFKRYIYHSYLITSVAVKKAVITILETLLNLPKM